jgi:hypothetical protein
MKRVVDKTPIICKICYRHLNVGGFRTHLQMKHPDYDTDRYVSEFGEFRPKKLKHIENTNKSDIVCEECNKKMATHKELMHHIRVHNMNYEQYHIKYKFGGIHPVCKCGCGVKVKIIKGGILDDTGKRVFARDFITGHNTCMSIGVQTRTFESRMKMRESAIKRMERDGNRFSPKTSSAQREIYEFIQSISDGFMEQDTSLLYGREIDIVNHEKKIGIEYNGLYFHSDIYRDRKYHLSKLKEMEKLGYRLVYIWEDWWVRKKEIVKSMLSSVLSVGGTKIYARKCDVREITDESARIFLGKNHIQGPSVSKIRIGLFYNEELVSVMTFGKLRATLGSKSKEGHWEMMRFCSSLNTTVVGGASKLFSFFIKKYNPICVISFANRDWSVGNVYDKIGFKLLGATEPGYFYAKGKRRFNRSMFTKHKLIESGADKAKTESIIMKERGYMKIWDTGNIKFEWKPK